ncbi:MAG: glycosyltransferase family 2 protein [Verrucomicrobia bacterium]|nr:glycosyltransferase family 2 protein [Verrucomicrobiota bacterium]
MNKDPIDLQRFAICVVVPMYKVEREIQDVIRGIPKWIRNIVVVDDESPDASLEKVKELGDPRVTAVRHEENQGVGGAMMTGYAKAMELGAEIMVKMDGDNQMSPDYLPALIRPIAEGRADYAKGNRFTDNRLRAQMPLVRRIGNIGLSFMTKMASGYWNMFDPTNGYTAISAEVYRLLNLERVHKRYFFESSLFLELNLVRAVVADVPMPARYADESSSMSIPRVLYQFPYRLTRGFLYRMWLEYFVLDFSVASLFIVFGLLLTLFGGIWGAVAWISSLRSGVVASTGTVMIAVLPLIMGFQLLLQALVFDVQNVPRQVRTQHLTAKPRDDAESSGRLNEDTRE